MQLNSTKGNAVASLTIRKIDPGVKERLRRRAAEHGHSMEEEARRILSSAVEPAEPMTAYDLIRMPFNGIEDIELNLPKRTPARDVPPI